MTEPGSEGQGGFQQLMKGPTGLDERLVPEVADSGNLAQHIMRYRFSLPYCPGKVVVDAGTGVGYGAGMIAEVANQVYALDYDAAPVRHGMAQYGSSRLRFLVADVTHLPLKDASADVVLSFEVIEHVSDHLQLLREACRVLKHHGILIASTPNAETAQLFRRKAGFTYDAHVSEVGLTGFQRELQSHFAKVRIWGMRLRGTPLYGILRALDPWNLRLRLLPRRGIDFARERVFRVPSQAVSCSDVIISSWHLRQANHFVAICSHKRS